MPQDSIDHLIGDYEEFFSKENFDFSTVAGWEEYLAERAVNGSGRDMDGLHARDLSNFQVYQTNFQATDTVTVRFLIEPLPGQRRIPAGNLYVYYPDSSWQRQARSFWIGPGSSLHYTPEVGGPTPNGEEYWSDIKFIAFMGGKMRRPPPATRVLRALSKAMRRGISVMGTGYFMRVQVGNGPVQVASFMEQRIFSTETWEEITDYFSESDEDMPLFANQTNASRVSSARPLGTSGSPASVVEYGNETNTLDALSDDRNSSGN
ncbi:hypothetical protein [Vannielia sp.]|uniref:hypothetical protein n=1 Tax=Vannielia sp. TaxID=2813045 RepID=UPI00262094C6|nr:hypothetical protein [Vannielia sp.]MDF1873685.1 hypothetical protein [Vannielia sp.]